MCRILLTWSHFQLTNSSENQVVPFHISTPDGVTLYAWLIAPLRVFAAHEKDFLDDVGFPGQKVEASTAFKLLKSDPESRLIIYCESDYISSRYF